MTHYFLSSVDRCYLIKVLGGFVLAGFAVLMFPKGETWGYGTISLGLMGMMFIQFALTHDQYARNTIQLFIELIKTALPIFITVITALWLVMINIKYYDIISTGIVPSEYYSFISMSNLLLLLQSSLVMYIIMNTIKNADFDTGENAGMFTRALKPITLLLSTIALIVVGLVHVVLEFFTTDG
jgi:hypothetical protein